MNERHLATLILGSLPMLFWGGFAIELHEAGNLGVGLIISVALGLFIGVLTYRFTKVLER